MSTPTPDPDPDPPPGTEPALEPDTLPSHPLRADDVPQLLSKEIG